MEAFRQVLYDSISEKDAVAAVNLLFDFFEANKHLKSHIWGLFPLMAAVRQVHQTSITRDGRLEALEKRIIAIEGAKSSVVVERAFSTLEIKSIDEDQRIIRGIATTPRPDRVGDVIEPMGITFGSNVKLLLHHDKTKPVGQVSFDTPTPNGVSFTAQIAKIAESGLLKDRVDEAWHSVKAGILDSVSIGFRVIDDAVERIRDQGLRFLKTEIVELSLVAVPANTDASISAFRTAHLDAPATSELSFAPELVR
jgi:HK97 family phage prohead protease